MTYDIIIFGGQSNMQGQTGSLPIENSPIEGAFEYKLLKDTLTPLVHPVGEKISTDLLLGADSNGGSLVPDFCRAYVRETGRNVVAIHAARGATTVSEWLPGTDRYSCSIEKIKSGINKAKELGNVGNIYYVWLQGESDAIMRTKEDDYIRMLTAYKNDLKNDAGIEIFGIIEVGYFCGVVSWLTDRTRENGKTDDEVIMRAQERLPNVDKDFVILTDICKKLSLTQSMLNPNAEGHYNNEAMAIIGEYAGCALAKIQKNARQ